MNLTNEEKTSKRNEKVEIIEDLTRNHFLKRTRNNLLAKTDFSFVQFTNFMFFKKYVENKMIKINRIEYLYNLSKDKDRKHKKIILI